MGSKLEGCVWNIFIVVGGGGRETEGDAEGTRSTSGGRLLGEG